MKDMAVRYVTICATLCFYLAKALETDPDCADLYATRASVTLQGKAQDFEKYPPPYSFVFADSSGRATSEYADGVYTVRVSGGVPFQGFIIQARLATKQGFVIGHLPAGQFVEEASWEKHGIQFLECPNSGNSSITSANDQDKYMVEAKWQAIKKEGPVQFVITVIQNEDTFWSVWQPLSGFIVPSKAANFSDHRSKLQDHNVNVTTAPLPSSSTDSDSESEETTAEEESKAEAKTAEDSSVAPIRRFHISLGKGGRLSIKAAEPEINTEPPEVHYRRFPEPPSFNMSNSGEERDENSLAETEDNSQLETTTSLPSTPIVFSTTITHTVAVSTAVDEKTTFASLPTCDINVCEHNGTCKGYPRQNRYICQCQDRWTGRHCDEPNHCHKNKCENGICISDDKTGTYSCECNGEWAGKYCERPCPSYLCLNGGNCTIGQDGEYGCICPTGYTGKNCETDIDDCPTSGCLHGKCVDKLNDFECHCFPGYMGDRCHRPCQDIYKSCEFWGEQDRCETMRPTTRFFDINCAVTCGQCEFDNSTISPNLTVPPVLEPLEFLLGTWTLNSTSARRFPLDFSATSAGYYEILEFAPAEVPQFGTPSISYSSRAVSHADPSDQQITVGFMTLGPGTNPLKVSIMHTGNDGMTIREEGILDQTKLELELVYLSHAPGLDNIIPARAKRHFAIKGPYLQETVERHGTKGQSEYFAKYFIRESR